LHIFGKKEALYCTNCNVKLKHKYKPQAEWKIQGLLCAECHIEKTKEFILKKQDEKKRIEEAPTECTICKKEIVLEIDKKKPRWQWNMESGSMLCKNCYNNKEADYDKKLNFCAICNKKMGFIRYNPKPKWEIEGQLCRECWDKRNK
jgi:hypothetical protein